MSAKSTLITAGAAAILLAACLTSSSEAQRRQATPPPMETTFEPVETRVEVRDDATVVTFGDRSFTLRSVTKRDGTPRTAIEGRALYNRDGYETRTGWQETNPDFLWRLTEETWLLPGFGLLGVTAEQAWPSIAQHLNRPEYRARYFPALLRGRDGVLNPIVPGNVRDVTHFAARSGVHDNGLAAGRTLFITGSTWHAPNTFSGMLPPASTFDEAILGAEAFMVYMSREIRAHQDRVFAANAEIGRQLEQEWQRQRAAERANRAAAWGAAFSAIGAGLSQGADNFTPSSSGTRPSALGPDFYWDGDQLIHRPSGRRVD